MRPQERREKRSVRWGGTDTPEALLLKTGLTSEELNTSEKTVLYLKRSGPVQGARQNSSPLERPRSPSPSAPLLAATSLLLRACWSPVLLFQLKMEMFRRVNSSSK